MDISDHYGIFHIMDKQCTTNDSSQLLRVINESRIEKYKDCISNTDWTALNVYENCETYYKYFIDEFKNIYDHVFPKGGFRGGLKFFQIRFFIKIFYE